MTQLESELDEQVSVRELERVQQEWETSERLLEQSQRWVRKPQGRALTTGITNQSTRRSSNTNTTSRQVRSRGSPDRYAGYGKSPGRDDRSRLESEFVVVITSHHVQSQHGVQTPVRKSTIFSASTPLPKPMSTSLRRSTSMLSPSKRTSRLTNRHASLVLPGKDIIKEHLVSASTYSSSDGTPTSAMRKLVGDHRPTALNDRTRAPGIDAAKSQSCPQTAQPTSVRVLNHSLPSCSPAEDSLGFDTKQLEQLRSLLQQVHSPSLAPSKRDSAAASSDHVLDQARQFVEEAEKRARARETRLGTLLMEASNFVKS